MKRFVKTLEPLSGLPNGFTEVEYLQSLNNNDFAIDTGITGHDGVESEVCVWFDSQVNNQCVLGSWSNASTRAWLCYTFGKKWYIGYVGTNQTAMDLVPNQWNYVKTTIDTSGAQGRATLTVNDEVAGSVSYNKNWDNGVNLTLFRMNNDTGGDYYGSTCKVSLCKIWDNGVLVRDFIPCLDLNDTPCMYDRIEGKAYYNIGQGTFTTGRQIIPVEYLRNTDTQYINTGYKPNNNTRVQSKFKMNETTSNFAWFFLARNQTVAGDGFGFGADGSGNITSDYNNRVSENVKLVSGTEYTLDKNKNVCKYNNSTLTNTESSFTINSNLCIWALNDNNNINYSLGTKSDVYYFKIYDNDVLVKDFIPAIDENDVGYMFDKVTHILYENKGTGSFSYGEKVYKQKLRLVEEKSSMRGLPNGFTEVEYLEATGTQYIDTGVTLANPLKVDMELAMLHPVNSGTADSNYPVMFGANDGDTRRNIFIRNNYGDYQSNTVCRVEADIGNTYNRKDINYGKRFKFYYDQSVSTNNTIIDGTTYTYPVGDWNVSCSLYLFAQNNNGTLFRRGVGRIYKCKLWISNVLVRDFIPVLDPLGTPCMYDLVNKKVYYNKGTGTFQYGKQIIPVEYLENTETGSSRNWINTGIVTDSNTKWEVKVSYNDTGTGKLMGSGIGGDTRFNLGIESSKFRFGFASGWFDANSEVSTPDTNPHIWILDSATGTGTIDGYTATTTNTFGTNTYPIGLFGRTNNVTSIESSNTTVGKIYYSKIWKNNVLVQDLIPVIDENNVGYMFDKVTHSLYENKGTGAFSYGKKVYKRRLRLASEPWYMINYDLLTYLEATGTQWINTGVYGNLNTKIEAKVYSQKSGSDSGYCIAGDFTTSTKAITMPFNFTSDGLYSRFGDKSITSGIQQQAGTYTIAVDKDGYYVDGVKIANFNTTTSFTTDGTIMLFGFTGLGRNYLKGKMYYCTILDNGVLVHDFRPAKRKLDNKYGMLDMVTRQFYTNAGTGDFTGE